MRPRIIYIVFLVTAFLSAQPVFGKEVPKTGRAGATIYNDYSIPLPEGKTLDDVKITAGDLKLTDKYIDLYPEGLVDADQKTLRLLYDYYLNDRQGKTEWSNMVSRTVKAVSAWDMHKIINKRYVYSFGNLKSFAMVYLFTGNEIISDFIRGHMAKAASLPIDFWIHAELRKFFPEKPQGYIETAYLNEAFSIALAVIGRNMSETEFNTFRTAWYEKGYIPGLNWLDAHPVPKGNFTAVIANGIVYAAKYFKDEEGFKKGLSHLKMYADDCILADGSNYEGYSYFDYPARQLTLSCLVMTPEEINDTFGGCALSKAMTWRVAGLLLGRNEEGKPGEIRITYGDNPCIKKMWGAADVTSWFCKYVGKDRLASWIVENWKQKKNASIIKLETKFQDLDLSPVTPEEAGIPLLTTFKSGDCYMRSGWGDDDVVLGLKQVNGDKSKGSYPHARPEINSINLGAFGEYLICNSASASYRSHIRSEHDIRTWRANTVTIDGKDQLFHYKFFNELGCYGLPDAQIVRKETLPDGTMILSNEAKDAYATPMKQATRTVEYIPEGRFFIVKDVLVPEDGEAHHYDHRFFIFNHDFKTVFSQKGSIFRIERPNAELYIAVQGSEKMDFTYREDAYIHGLTGRDYDPDGPMQGKPGSARGLQWSCDAKSLTITSVLYPQKPGQKAPKIKFGKGNVVVNGRTYDLNQL